jgi:hypothetical protein
MPTAPQIQERPDSRSPSARFDTLLFKLRGESNAELLIEHLQTAHAYLLGAMREECAANLDLARKAADTLSDRYLQREAQETVDYILGELHRLTHRHGAHLAGHPSWSSLKHEPPATAGGLAEFFHGADVRFGLFYPIQHVMAVFPSWERALAGKEILHQAGLQPGDVLAVPGPELTMFLQDRRVHRGVWARLATQFSRLLDTEAALVDHYIQWGRRGAGFLIAYCRTETDMNSIPELLKPLQPSAMHGFTIGYIRHLV